MEEVGIVGPIGRRDSVSGGRDSYEVLKLAASVKDDAVNNREVVKRNTHPRRASMPNVGGAVYSKRNSLIGNRSKSPRYTLQIIVCL
jgi:hypothetical protein